MQVEPFTLTMLASASLLLITAQYIVSHKTLTLGLYFNIYWFLFLSSSFVFYDEYAIYLSGVTFILFCMFLVFLAESSVLSLSTRRPDIRVRYMIEFRNPTSIDILFFSCFLLFIAGGFGLYAIVLSSEWSGSVFDVIGISSHVTDSRYLNKFDYPVASKIILAFQYALIGISAMYYLKYKKFKIYFALPFLVVLFYATVLTTKLVFIIGMIFYISPIIASNMSVNYKKFIVLFFLVFAILFGLIALREDLISTTLFDVLEKFKLYALGHVGAFSYWFHNIFNVGDELYYGLYNFGGLFQILGFGDRVQGVYELDETWGLQTNIFTIFRGLLSDFGLLGTFSLIYLASVFSLVREVFYPGLLTFYIRVVFVTVLLLSFAVNILNYNTVLLALFLFFTLLWRCCKLEVVFEKA